MKVAIVGLDIAKNVFQLHGTDRDGKVVLRAGFDGRKSYLFSPTLQAAS